jgi:hypothetical protein
VYGGLAASWGELAEKALRAHYERLGFFVIPLFSMNQSGAPMATMQWKKLVLSDLLLMKSGRTEFAEIKYKDHADKYQKRQQWQHAIDLPNWNAYLQIETESGVPGRLSILQFKPGKEAEPDPCHLWQYFSVLKQCVQIVSTPHTTFHRGAAYFPIEAFKCSPINFVPPSALPALATNVNPWERKSKAGIAPQWQIKYCEESPWERYACVICGQIGQYGYKREDNLHWYCEAHRRADELTSVETMTLKQIQTELRSVSGTPLRFDGDIARRQQLWQRLDLLITG